MQFSKIKYNRRDISARGSHAAISLKRPISPKGILTLDNLFVVYLVTVFAMPQFFGIPTPGFAFTVQRIMTIVMLLALFVTPAHGRPFIRSVLDCHANIYFLPMLFVYLYTAIARSSVASVMQLVADDLIAFYICAYMIKEVLDVERTVDVLVKIVAVVCCVAIFDMLRRWNPYQLIHTISSIKGGSGWRANSYRVSAMCSHPIGFGMYLMLMLPVVCFDVKKRHINIVRHPIVLLLSFLAILGTGSRGPQAFFFVEFVILFLLTNTQVKKQVGGYIVLAAVFLVAICVMFNEETHINKWVWLNVCQVVDSVFGTDFTLQRYGYWQAKYISLSSGYRDYLPLIFFSSDLDPLIGQGNQGDGISFTVAGYHIASVDNFYVLQYIRYAWPGVITTLFCFAGMLAFCIWCIVKSHHRAVYVSFALGFLCYFINLWTVADLGTMKYLFALFALVMSLADSDGVPSLVKSRKDHASKNVTDGHRAVMRTKFPRK